MGCITSKHVSKAASSSPIYTHYRKKPKSSTVAATVDNASAQTLDPSSKTTSNDHHQEKSDDYRSKSKNEVSNFSLGVSQRYIEAEQVAAGWPSWLSSAAAEAVHGWVPLRADSFEKLEKIGQGTYSSVFRAREVDTGRIVALKKVRFHNFLPDSIRFMAREIIFLRRLEHPNIMELQGIITSKMSTSIYLVFEYMEHDLAGLVSSPDVEFSESQVKCYMRQLLSAIEHCHVRGIMHRDIKTSNILVNNEGVLKLADFGLANVANSRKNKQQALTSRVVTLWYRPPELLMGSTDYGLAVDLWSIGCVFAELHFGKPLLKGRTEVEQLHKIFKLCGSPSEDFWKETKLLPNAAMFRPQHAYESSLNEKCKEFAPSAVRLLEIFLAVEPHKRGTASSALMSEYFKTKPYACDPSTLPKYPPNKEMDAKNRERTKRANVRPKETGATKRPRKVRRNLQEFNSHNKVAIKEVEEKNNVSNLSKEQADTTSEASQGATTAPNHRGRDSAFIAPIPVSASSDIAWVKNRKEEIATSAISDGIKSQFSALDPSFANYTSELTKKQNGAQDYDDDEHQKQQGRKDDFPESFDASEAYPLLDMSNEPKSNATTDLDNDHRIDGTSG